MMMRVRLYVFASLLFMSAGGFCAQEDVRIGVYAYRAKPQVQAQWAPLANALNNAQLGFHFVVQAYNPEELEAVVSSRQVDFILTTPSQYLLIADRSGLSAPIATMENIESGRPVSAYGGVIFTRADRKDIRELRDIRGKSVATFGLDSFGSFQMQAYELLASGLDLKSDVRIVTTGMPQDKVVDEVMSGRVDVGMVRSGLLERLAKEGKLDLNKIFILNRQNLPDFPVAVSTRLYPEWPFSAMPHIDRNLKRKISAFLFGIEENRALVNQLGINGFQVSADYASVEAVLRELRIAPFDAVPNFTWRDILSRYRWSFLAGMIAVLLILTLSFNLFRSNRRLKIEKDIVQKQSNQLNESESRLTTLLDELKIHVWAFDGERYTYTNKQWFEYTGQDVNSVLTTERWLSAVHPDDVEASGQTWKTNWEAKSEHDNYFRLKRHDGVYREFFCHAVPIFDHHGVFRYFQGFNLDITERKQIEAEIRNLALYDPLTGLPNRRMLLDRLQQTMASSSRNNKEAALLFIDLDHFKDINDTLGHSVGDKLLQMVAARLIECVRGCDTVARLGGDEFVVMLDDLNEDAVHSAEQAEAVGNKILAALNLPYLLSGHQLHNSPSIGIALFNGYQQSKDELLKQADIAMYQSKKSGRNTLSFFDPGMQKVIDDRALLAKELNVAIELQQFTLHYQIQVNHLSQAVGAEALIRWKHPDRGLVLPMQFIPLAEETGIIVPIGLWVLDRACAQLGVWQQDERTRDLALAVNVSAQQFHHPDFVAQVREVLFAHAVQPSKLKLELTESTLADDIEGMILKMRELKALGVQFSLDDFGTGYSSMQYLKRLPIDQLKIDQSFVRDLDSNASDQAIVRTIIAMAQSLNLELIAEGVETQEQRQLLLDKGCFNFQGYLFSKPIALDEFEALLNKV
jgi:diguanylate cyclase (GGDEF)-like protein/PAS domain S-box-containing protein